MAQTGVVSWSQTAATNGSVDATINFAEGQAPSSVNDSARAVMAAIAKYRDDQSGSVTTGGTTTAYTATSNTGFVALTAGYEIAFNVNATNTGTSTIAIDGLAAKPLRSAAGVEITSGMLGIGQVHRATYFTSNSGEWILHSIRSLGPLEVATANIAASAVTTAKIAAANVTYATIQNVAASSLLGNPTGSGAAPSEITLGSGLAFSSTTLKATLSPPLVPNYLSGLTLSTAGASGTMSIAAGVANDSTNTTLMSLAAISKTTASWAVGSGNGGIDTGSIANSTWYHFYLIERTDTGVTDVIFSLSASAPAFPTSYTLTRYIGSAKTDGSAHWTAFTQVGDKFIWAAAVTDVNAIAATAARVVTTLTVPTGIVVSALFRGGLNSTSTGTMFPALIENDVAPVNTGNADLCAVANGSFERLTNTSAQIGVRSSAASGNVSINTFGWIDTRGK
jgi:hypothetical protein